MNKIVIGSLLATAVAASGIGGYFAYSATLSDKSEIDAIVDTLTDEQMAPIEKVEHIPVKADLEKTLIINVLNDLKEIKKHNGYTGIARKWKISRTRVRAIERSVTEEKMSRLPKEVVEEI